MKSDKLNTCGKVMWWLGIFLCLVGFTVSCLMAWHTEQMSERPFGHGLPGCSALNTSCDSVVTSNFSRVLGIPLTTFGQIYFFILIGLLFCFRLARTVRSVAWWSRLVLWCSTTGLATAGWSLGVMREQLGVFCPWCVLVQIVNVFMFLVGAGIWTKSRRVEGPAGNPRPPFGFKLQPLFHLLPVAAIFLGQTIVLSKLHDRPDLRVVPTAVNHFARLQDAAKLDRVSTKLGCKNPDVEVVAFICPTCPPCKRFVLTLNELLQSEFPNVAVQIRFCPLSGKCNAMYEGLRFREKHDHACDLSRLLVAVATAESQRFGEYFVWLMRNQGQLSFPAAVEEAQKRFAGTRLDQLLNSDDVKDRVQVDCRLAESSAVRTVPRLFVPGGTVYGEITKDTLRTLLRTLVGSNDRTQLDSAVATFAMQGMRHE